jgi:hypothetical protein
MSCFFISNKKRFITVYSTKKSSTEKKWQGIFLIFARQATILLAQTQIY